MKSLKLAAFAALLSLSALPLSQAGTLTLPPLKVPASASALQPAGDWKAPAEALDYAATKKQAQEAETAGKFAEALTAWERVIDRTSCTEADRDAARTRIRELRPKVQPNTDPAKAHVWNVLALIYKEVDIQGAAGSSVRYHQVMNPENLATIAKELAGWRDLVFEFSSGLVLLDIDAVVVDEPLKQLTARGGKYSVDVHDALPAAKKELAKKKYDTIISYAKYRKGDGQSLPRPFWTAATVGRVREFGGVGYIMIPWGDDYPFVGRGELWGEMELHEWLHQIDDVVRHYLGYPKGVAQNPDNGQRDPEYTRPRSVHTWAYFYKHAISEHLTRQILTELAINPPQKPGSVIKIGPASK
ncbi:MAG: hypothetical protein LBV54_05975 [Puniceicoccales bacterium]|nr:hypothetical protein [Puniceicoccales bacterium]